MQNDTHTSTRHYPTETSKNYNRNVVEGYLLLGGCILVTIGGLSIAATVSPLAFGVTAFGFGVFWTILFHKVRQIMKVNRLKMIMKKKHEEADNAMFKVVEDMVEAAEQQSVEMRKLLDETHALFKQNNLN